MRGDRKGEQMKSGFTAVRNTCGLVALIMTVNFAGGLIVSGPVEAGSGEYAFVLTTDYYSAGYYSTIDLAPPRDAMISIKPVNSDAVAYYDLAEDKVFVINRYLADNIQIVDTDSAFSTIGQYSVGNGSNPHDIRLADGTKAYVSRFEWKTLLVCHPYTGDSLGAIDLSPLADADGIPEMDRMEIIGDRLFVTLNSINHTTWQPDGPGKVAVIDTEADTLVDCNPDSAGVQPIVLNLMNPYTELRYNPATRDLYVGCLGTWGAEDGGIEIIDPQNLESKGVLMSEVELSGDVSDVVLLPDGGGYAVVFEAVPWPDNFARLVRFDEITGLVTDTLYQQTSGSGSSLAGIELNRQMELYLCDRDLVQPGVRVYDVATNVELDFVDVGLPPFDITFIQTSQASIGEEFADLRKTGAISSHPNPFVSYTTITLNTPFGEDPQERLYIFDAMGRRLRTLAMVPETTGRYACAWDGRDDLGRLVAPGVYFCSPADGRYDSFNKILFVR
jgi:hypothetical protein